MVYFLPLITRNNNSSFSKLHHFDGDFFGGSNTTPEYLWPLDEHDSSGILCDLLTTDRDPRLVVLQAVEIEVIDVISVFLIVRICWTSHNKSWVIQVFSQDMSDHRALARSEISYEEYPISWSEGDIDIVKLFFLADGICFGGFLHFHSI